MSYLFPPDAWALAIRAALYPLASLALMMACVLSSGISPPSVGEAKDGVEMVISLMSLAAMLRGRV